MIIRLITNACRNNKITVRTNNSHFHIFKIKRSLKVLIIINILNSFRWSLILISVQILIFIMSFNACFKFSFLVLLKVSTLSRISKIQINGFFHNFDFDVYFEI